MGKKTARDVFTNINRPQEKVLFPFYFSCLIIVACFVGFGYLLVKHPLFNRPGNYLTLVNARGLNDIQIMVIVFGLALAFMLIAMIFWAYTMSNKILGPYERIIEELDVILEGRKQGLKVRKGDEMFDELIKRINILIEKAFRPQHHDNSQGHRIHSN